MKILICSFLFFSQFAQSATDLSRADQDFRNRIHEESAREALAIYRKASDENSDSIEASWKRSMACYFVGLRLEKNKNLQEELYREGQTWGRKSVARSPRCAECHFWTAINMALYGQSVGAVRMLFSLQEIEDHLEKSLSLDPHYADAGAYRLLALIQQKLPGILGGSTDRAAQYYEKAIATSPAPLNFLFFSQFAREELHNQKRSQQLIAQGIAGERPKENYLEQMEAYDQLVALRRAF